MLGGCGLWTKQRQAEVIYRSRNLAYETKTAKGVLHLVYIPTPSEEEQGQQIPGVPNVPRTISARADFDLNFAQESARLILGSISLPVEQEQSEPEPAVSPGPPVQAAVVAQTPAPVAAAPAEAGTLFHGGTVFVKRANLRSAGKRVWAKLDFTKLDDDEPRPSADSIEGPRYVIATFNTLNPLYLFDLALGALPGSVERDGKESIGGVETTKYKSNISIERSINELELDDEEIKTRTLMFNLLSVFQEVQPGAFWLDERGLVKRLRVNFVQVVSRTERNFLVMNMDISSYGEPTEVPRPGGDETVEVERYARLVRIAVP